ALIRSASSAVPVAIASGSRPHEIRPILRRFGVESVLRALVSAEDVARTKPDPEPYLKAAAALGADPRDCLAIEDTPTGARAAVAAGFVVVGVEHTNRAAELEAVGAHHVVSEIGALSPEALRVIWDRCVARP
ncbi:MAG: HAD-IA family hydrolase, partial [Phycisphaerales bacterium]|nr:HAD-IA family hydrolase [Phycisphaerales bacterium]